MEQSIVAAKNASRLRATKGVFQGLKLRLTGEVSRQLGSIQVRSYFLTWSVPKFNDDHRIVNQIKRESGDLIRF